MRTSLPEIQERAARAAQKALEMPTDASSWWHNGSGTHLGAASTVDQTCFERIRPVSNELTRFGKTTMLKKLISAGDDRRSRFHTEDNVFIGWSRLFSETPIVAAQKIRSKVTGTRPIAPWWPLPAIQEIEKRLKPSMKAIEFGSGSSSIWIAKRVGSLMCREHDEVWAGITRQRLETEGITNCEVQHRTADAYYLLDPDDSFDFAVVDGEYRWKCLEFLADKINQGGMIYFDNSDSDKDTKHYSGVGLTGSRHAQGVIRELEKAKNLHVTELHGMIHGELFAGSGMLVAFP